METGRHEVTARLKEWSAGEPEALGDLLPLVVEELRRIAASYFRGEDKDHTLQPTALVNEVCLKLYGQRRVSWENRRQFFAFASKLMRRILIDYSRTRKAAKRGRQLKRISLSDALDVGDVPPLDPDQLLDLSRALDRLEREDSRTTKVVELRFFAGLSLDECAAALGVGTATVKRDWAFARRWLARELREPAYRDDPRPENFSL